MITEAQLQLVGAGTLTGTQFAASTHGNNTTDNTLTGVVFAWGGFAGVDGWFTGIGGDITKAWLAVKSSVATYSQVFVILGIVSGVWTASAYQMTASMSPRLNVTAVTNALSVYVTPFTTGPPLTFSGTPPSQYNLFTWITNTPNCQCRPADTAATFVTVTQASTPLLPGTIDLGSTAPPTPVYP